MTLFKQNMKNFFRISDFLKSNGLEIQPTGPARIRMPNFITRNGVVVGNVYPLKIGINEPLNLAMFGVNS